MDDLCHPPARLCVLQRTSKEEPYGMTAVVKNKKRVMVSKVEENSIADKSWIRQGDVIMMVNGNCTQDEEPQRVKQWFEEDPLCCELLVMKEDAADWYVQHEIRVTRTIPNLLRVQDELNVHIESGRESGIVVANEGPREKGFDYENQILFHVQVGFSHGEHFEIKAKKKGTVLIAFHHGPELSEEDVERAIKSRAKPPPAKLELQEGDIISISFEGNEVRICVNSKSHSSSVRSEEVLRNVNEKRYYVLCITDSDFMAEAMEVLAKNSSTTKICDTVSSEEIPETFPTTADSCSPSPVESGPLSRPSSLQSLNLIVQSMISIPGAATDEESSRDREEPSSSQPCPSVDSGIFSIVSPPTVLPESPSGREPHTTVNDYQMMLEGLDVLYQSDLKYKGHIGSGSQGAVNLMSTEFHKQVAVKYFNRNELNDGRAMIELRNTWKLGSDPNIIQLRGLLFSSESDFNRNKPPIGYLMEYMDCGSLYEVIHGQTFDYDYHRALEWIQQASSALSFLHRKNVIHRDIKPANLLLGNNFQLVKIGDLGASASLKKCMTADAGTITYTAPEMFSTKEGGKNSYNEKVDVYALGITIWELLHKKIPYEDLSSYHCSIQIRNGHRPEIDEALAGPLFVRLLPRLWAVDFTSRMTMKELYSEVKKVLESYE